MLFEILAASMINPSYDLLAANNPTKEFSTVQKKIQPDFYAQSFLIPEENKTKFIHFYDVINYYTPYMKTVLVDFNSRKNIESQYLKWVELPKQQLQTKHLDEIYTQANMLKSRRNNVIRPLIVLGIGGSKHTTEFLLNMNGIGNKGIVYFYSDIDPISFSNFLKEVKTPIQDLNFLVVSKSGTTFETKDSFVRFEKMLGDYYKTQGLNEEQAKQKAQSHFAICTDKKSTAKNLRSQIGFKNGKDNNYIKELYIHDGVGGRFSMFDDAGLFALAYSGVDKSIAIRILNSAAKTSERFSKCDIHSNSAARSAIFNVFARQNGYKLTQEQFFGHIFEGGGENWIKQLYLESLKDFDFVSTKAPDSMHYASEGFFYPQNRDKYNVVMTIMSPDICENYKRYVGAVLQSYAETVPVALEVLEIEGDKLKPEAIGEYVQSKHFETVYTGMLRRAVEAEKTDNLPEVIQSHVEVYKNKFKPDSIYELRPGE